MTVSSKFEEVSASSVDKDGSDHWQSGVKSLSHGVGLLYENGAFSDCTFTVNNKRSFKGHRLILGARSPVLKEWLLDKKQTKIAVDCSETGFEIFFRYIYTNELGETDTGRILDAYKVSIQYQQKEMIEECEKVIGEWEITSANVFNILNAALDVEFLKGRCLQYVRDNCQMVLQSDDFKKGSTGAELSPKALLTILQENCFSEICAKDLVYAVCNWGLNQFPPMQDCKPLREYLIENSILGLLNIQQLKVEELLKLMMDFKNLLTADECVLLQLHATDPQHRTELPPWCRSSS